MSRSLIYNFVDPIEYLNFEFAYKQDKNPKFSLRSWSKQLGYKNPSLLSQILKHKRSLNLKNSSNFIRNLNLEGSAKRYFELLVLYKQSKSIEEKKIYLDLLEKQRPNSSSALEQMSIDTFRFISDWYHVAILELINLKDFKDNPLWIKKALGGSIPVTEIEKAIKRLINLNLIEVTKSNKLKRRKTSLILSDSEIVSEAINSYHKQMIEKAKSALDSQPLKERDFRGSTICIKSTDFNKIKDLIKKFHSEVVKFAISDNAIGDDVYHLSSQFFKLTQEERDL